MPTLRQIIKEWDEKFDDEVDRLLIKSISDATCKPLTELKSFIHSRDKAILERVKEMVGSMKKKLSSSGCEICSNCHNADVCQDRLEADSYNTALQDIINLINKELE